MTQVRAQLDFSHENRVARITLAAPKANIVDVAMMADLDDARARLEGRRDLAAIVLEAVGPNFSYGASVEEHLPDMITDTLTGFHRLIRGWLDLPAPTLAAVRGHCLGAGLELVLACDLVVAEAGAQLGCPEIQLGVFPPAASALLPVRVGAGPAAELLLTGSSWSAERAFATGLVHRVAPEGKLEAVLNNWIEQDFLPRSPAALRQAIKASRRTLLKAAIVDLTVLEGQYLNQLMTEPDAVEGVRAFLEKRPPAWKLGNSPS